MYYEINEETAKRAKELSSFNDYKEGSATNEYKSVVDSMIKYAEEQKNKCKTIEAKDQIDILVDRFAKKYAEWVNRYNEIRCYCPSMMITGAGNFPIKKQQRQAERFEKHFEEYNKIMAIKGKIRSTVNGSYITKSCDENAIGELENKLKSLERYHEQMKSQNAYYRKHKTMVGYEGLDEYEAKEIDDEINNRVIHKNLPHPSFRLANNKQEMNRIKKRINELKAIKETSETPESVEEKYKNKYFKVVENVEDMRLRLFFNEKPDEKMRTVLKHHAFKWSPKNGCWQRQLTNNSRFSLKCLQESLDEMDNSEDNNSKV